MKQTEAIRLRDMLKKELWRMDNHGQSSSGIGLSILPKIVTKEMQRLNHAIPAAIQNIGPNISVYDLTVPDLEGESMLSHLLAEFDLSSAEETAKFKRTLDSELAELIKSNVRIPGTLRFIEIVFDYIEARLKKQRLCEFPVSGPEDNQIVVMDYKAARKMKDRLRTERNMIRNRARAKGVDPYYLLQLVDSEIERLREDIFDAVLSMESSLNEIKIPVVGTSMLSRIPAEYGLTCAEETEKFIQKLGNERKWLMSLPVTSLAEQYLPTFQFIQSVMDYAERYRRENRPSEVAVFVRTDDNQTLRRVRKRRHSR